MHIMEITKTDGNHYHLEVKGRIEEDVNDIQLLGMVDSKAFDMTLPEIIYRLDQLPIGYKMAVPYN